MPLFISCFLTLPRPTPPLGVSFFPSSFLPGLMPLVNTVWMTALEVKWMLWYGTMWMLLCHPVESGLPRIFARLAVERGARCLGQSLILP